MNYPEQPRLYRADLDCILGEDASEYVDLAWVEALVEDYGDFRSLVGVMRVAESYRDSIPLILNKLPTDDIDELIKFAYYSFGYKDESLEPDIWVPRHKQPDVAACNTAESLFLRSITKKSDAGFLNGIVYVSETGEPILFQKGLGEKTALGLGVISVMNSDETEVIYPEGWIYDVKFDVRSDSGERTITFHTAAERFDRDSNGRSVLSVQSVSSLRPVRPSVFAVKTATGITMASGYNAWHVDLDVHNVKWFVDRLASSFVSNSD